MKKTMQLGALALVSLTTGCASIVSGQYQDVAIEARKKEVPVAGAYCKLSNNKGTWHVTTPGSVTVQTSYGDLAVSCDRYGWSAGVAKVKSSTKPIAYGNILFGGVIGAGIDVSNGAAYRYPKLIFVEMGDTVVEQTTAVEPIQRLQTKN